MSLVGDRAAIAQALSEVGGVKGFAYRPTTLNAGDGWPLLGSIERGEGLAFIATWRVLILLPSDEKAASEWIDAHKDALVDAMQENDVGFVDRLEPALVKASGADQLALQITMRAEG